MPNTTEIVESLQLIIDKLLNNSKPKEQMKFEVRYWNGMSGKRESFLCSSYNEARLRSFELSEDFDNVHINDRDLGRVVMSFNSFKQ